MEIVLEGIDNVGKSTLAKSLSEELSIPIRWAGGKPASSFDALKDCVRQLSTRNMIFDRVTCISRLCYEIYLEEPDVRFLNKTIDAMLYCDYKFIWCVNTSGIEKMSSCDTPEHREYLDIYMPKIKNRYNQLFSTIPHFEYDYTYSSIDDVLKYIKENSNV